MRTSASSAVDESPTRAVRSSSAAAVAHRWGFGHVSRFAQAYRRTYGRAPGDTLRGR
jgi:AraC-like DNA-binding protein